MKKFKISAFGLVLSMLLLSSCTDDLNTEPKTDLTLEQLLEQDPNAMQGLLSKVYGSFALSGASGPGSTDTPGDDPGESPFLRGIINLEDFTADSMKNRWGDNGLDQLTTNTDWDENNKFFRYLYNRVYYTVPQCNNLISVLDNVEVSNKEQYVSELRFLRSLAYYYLIDCFGKGVLVTEDDLGSSVPKQQATRAQLFAFVESELLAIQATLPVTNDYGRANKSVARMLLAKLYLNAEVYSGTPRYSEALAQISLVINEGGYSLAPDFTSLFSGDNNVTLAKNEIIFPLIADPIASQSYGNTTYLVNGSLNAETMTIADYGAAEGWGGHRATSAWYGLFGSSAAALAASPDDRAHLFWTQGHDYTMTNYKTWTDGYPSIKFRNSNFSGSSAPTAFSGTDFPLYRLADAYLIYAECVLRGAPGSNSQALAYVNQVRTRSNAPAITAGELTLNFILDERGRELNFEGHRRTDLIRFGKFAGGSYLWPWKGGVPGGTAIPATMNLFPIPLKAMQANPNLTQNPGY